MTRLAPITRWMPAVLALALFIGISTACGDSPATEPVTEPEPTPVRQLSGSQQPTSRPSAEPATETPVPTAAAIPVASGQVSTSSDKDREPIVPSVPANTQESPVEEPAASDAPDMTAILAAFEQALNEIYESALPSVVYIRVPTSVPSSLQNLPGVPEDFLWGAGSGFVWDMEGHIVTNHHVVADVAEGSQEVTVIFADGTQAGASIVGSDPHSDLAVIKLDNGDWDLRPLSLGDSSAVRVGQLAVAIGAPFGQEFTMTSGIVSALGRNISGQGEFTIPEVIQTDAAINPGNSGGPLLDRLGRVIGINTQIISRSGNFSGVGMAVPVNIARKVVPPLIEDGEFNYPWLGVSIATVSSLYAEELDLPDQTNGALVISVVDDGPADRAGLRGSDATVDLGGVEYPSGGDIIVAIGPHKIPSSNELIAHLTYHNSPGDAVTLSILRNGQSLDVEVTLGQRPTLP